MDSSKVGAARNESGFTLIDMLFVIALIGLLSTLAIPGLDAGTRRGAVGFSARNDESREQRATELRDHLRPRLLFAQLPDAGRDAAVSNRRVPGAGDVGRRDVHQERLHLQHGWHGCRWRSRVVQRARAQGRQHPAMRSSRIRWTPRRRRATSAPTRTAPFTKTPRVTRRPCPRPGAPPAGAPIK